MAHYAKVVNGIVTKVIVAEADFFKHLLTIQQVHGYKLLTIQEVVFITNQIQTHLAVINLKH